MPKDPKDSLPHCLPPQATCSRRRHRSCRYKPSGLSRQLLRWTLAHSPPCLLQSFELLNAWRPAFWKSLMSFVQPSSSASTLALANLGPRSRSPLGTQRLKVIQLWLEGCSYAEGFSSLSMSLWPVAGPRFRHPCTD